jgi:hypothetical protein
VSLPEGLTLIDVNAFIGCYALTQITIPDQVTRIGVNAFNNCTSLATVVVGNGVTTIGGYAFQGCRKLKTVTIGRSLARIEENAFDGCNALSAVHIADLANWCNVAFESNPLAYAGHLYMNGSEIKALTIPDGVTSISKMAFRGCKGLTSLVVPNTVTDIAEIAFYGCSGLTTVTIPGSVAAIGDYAFCMCSSLTDIFVHAAVPMPIFGDTFSNYDTSTLHVPTGSLNSYSTAQYWKKFTHIVDDIDASAILTVQADEAAPLIFDVNGHRLQRLLPGVNIVKQRNGAVRKIVVR